MNYYNDNDKKACAWLRELIADGHLPPGDVDERSILEIKADELRGYDQCHFFAGVGFWSLALQWAGLGTTPGIWTGSCPCQPFSCAGTGKGTADERHLWPVFRDLIVACRPAVVFGEQVASAAVVGKVGRRVTGSALTVWIDGVRADLEAAGYACGHTVLGAHSVGAPHIRQRVYWVADAIGGGCAARRTPESGQTGGVAQPEQRSGACRPSDASGSRAWRDTGAASCAETGSSGAGRADGMHRSDDTGAHGLTCRPSDAELPDGRTEQPAGEPRSRRGRLGGSGTTGGAPHAGGPGLEEQRRGRNEPEGQSEAASARRTRDAQGDDQQRNRQSGQGVRRQEQTGGSMPWSDYRVHRYLDGKDRRIPTEPRLFPLADDRHPYHRGRVGLLRGAGNAIVPALAAEFIEAWKECQTDAKNPS